MSLGKAPAHEDMFRTSADLCDEALAETSIYKLLHRECHRLFPDEAFADLFQDVGRKSVPPRIVAVVMVLQRFEGLSDREAVDRFKFDLRWKFAAGGLSFDYPGFVHTVLVDMRARLRASARPNRVFDAVLDVAKAAGLVGRKRVLDSTALYDAVATQDTVTMIRSSIRALLKVAGEPVATELRGVLKRDDDYVSAGKPVCDWDDEAAREALVDALARDAYAVIALLDGQELSTDVKQAAELVATVVGQDLEQREDGVFRIARKVAKDRVISTVDPEARHGHKTSARGFDGYKGHVAMDPDSEIITATAVTAGNAGDANPADALLADLLDDGANAADTAETRDGSSHDIAGEPVATATPDADEPEEVYGDASYGTADLVEKLESANIEANVKVQPPSARIGMFSQDAFEIDPVAGTACCPNGVCVHLRVRPDNAATADFAPHCTACPLRHKCTSSKTGRMLQIHRKHATLARSRERQRDPSWEKRYRATRPKIERKIAHLMRRKHGGRRARLRGRVRIGHDFAMLAAAANLSRLAVLGAMVGAARSPTQPAHRRGTKDTER
jgi:hypothetical protein